MGIRPKIALRGFKPDARGIGHVLGELEAAVMEILWRSTELTVNQVEESLQRRRKIAHTTVLTTLDRMHRKGYLKREKQGKAFFYSPCYTRSEFEHGMAQEVLGAMLGQFTQCTISTFVELVGKNTDQLDRLEAMIREKRRTQKKGEKKEEGR